MKVVYKKRLRIISFVVLLFFALFLIFIIPLVFRFLSKAGQAEPKGLVIANVSPTSFSISWVTLKRADGAVMWGPTQDLGTTSFDMRKEIFKDFGKSYSHIVKLTNLSPNTTYFFRIVTNGKIYPDKEHPPYSFTTPSLNKVNPSGSLRLFGDSTVSSYDYMIIIKPSTDRNVYPFVAPVTRDGTWYIDVLSSYSKDNLKRVEFSYDTYFDVIMVGKDGVVKEGVRPKDSPISLSPDPNLKAVELIARLGELTGDIGNNSLYVKYDEKIKDFAEGEKPSDGTIGSSSESSTKGEGGDEVDNILRRPSISVFPTITPSFTNPLGLLDKTPSEHPWSDSRDPKDQSSFNGSKISYKKEETEKDMGGQNEGIYNPKSIVKLRFIQTSALRKDIPLSYSSINQGEIVSQNNDSVVVEFGAELNYPLIGNVSEDGLLLAWRTQKPATGIVRLLLPNGDEKILKDSRGNGRFYFHIVNVKDLIPGEKYIFVIGNKRFSFKMPPRPIGVPSSYDISGIVDSMARECLIIGQLKDESKLSDIALLVTEGGSPWSLDVGVLRLADYSAYFPYNQNSRLSLKTYCVDKVGRLLTGELETTLYKIRDNQIIINLSGEN